MVRRRIAGFFARRGWLRIAYYISPSIASYYAGELFAQSLLEGMAEKDGDSNG